MSHPLSSHYLIEQWLKGRFEPPALESSMMFKVMLETQDGSIISPGTGRSKSLAYCSRLPSDGDTILFHYIGDAASYSMGATLVTDNVQVNDNVYKFTSGATSFIVTVLENDYDPAT